MSDVIHRNWVWARNTDLEKSVHKWLLEGGLRELNPKMEKRQLCEEVGKTFPAAEIASASILR